MPIIPDQSRTRTPMLKQWNAASLGNNLDSLRLTVRFSHKSRLQPNAANHVFVALFVA